MRNHIQKEDLERINRNECLFPSIISDIEFGVDITSTDFTHYNSAFDIENKLRKTLDTEFVFTNNGSDSIIKQIIECLSRFHNEWVIPTPSYRMAEFYLDFYNCKIETPNYVYNNNFKLDLEYIDRKQNKILYIVSPHNPTGLTLSYEDVDKLCKQFKYVIIDEAYIRPDSNILIKRDNLILVRTFSKLGGITGLRFGLGICFDKKLYEKFIQIRPTYLNAITLKYVEYILDNFITHKIEQKIKEEIARLDIDKIVAAAGNFILLKNKKTFNKLPLKEYIISGKKFYRMTVHEI